MKSFLPSEKWKKTKVRKTNSAKILKLGATNFWLIVRETNFLILLALLIMLVKLVSNVSKLLIPKKAKKGNAKRGKQ